MNTKILSVGLIVGKAMLGLSNKEKIREQYGADRPAWMSRRAIGTTMAVLSGLLGFFGATVDPATQAQLVDLFGQLSDIVVQNKALWGTIWGLCLAIWGVLCAVWSAIRAGK